MSQGYEKDIQELLLNNKDSDTVASLIVKKIMTESPGRKERQAYVNFLIHSGHYKNVFDLYVTWFQEQDRIPLFSFCYALCSTGFKPDNEFFGYLLQTQQEIHKEDQLPHFLMWENANNKLKILRKEYLGSLADVMKRKRDSLFAKLEFFRAQRMFEEEHRLLNEMATQFPGDPDLQEELKHFKNRWADNIIARASNRPIVDTEDDRGHSQNESEKIAALPIINEVINLAKRKKVNLYDLAIALYFFELFDDSLKIIRQAPKSLAHDWFQIELLIKCRRYVECLDALVHVEKSYADDPETSFAAVYYRARALRALGSTDRAIELMKSIVNIRPNYRSSHALLLKWSQNT